MGLPQTLRGLGPRAVLPVIGAQGLSRQKEKDTRCRGCCVAVPFDCYDPCLGTGARFFGALKKRED